MMKDIKLSELVKIENNQPVTSSKMVAKTFDKAHDKVMRDIKETINKIGTPNLANEMFMETTYENRGKQYPMFLMTEKGFNLVAMSYTTAKAMKYKLAFLDEFERMKQQLMNQQTPSYLIENRAERARAWAEEEEERMRLAQENQKQAKYIEENAERTNLGKAIEHSETDILVRQLSKILKGNGIDIGEKRLFKYLRNNGYLIAKKGRDYNSPTQKSMDLGLFKVKETTFERNNQVFTKSTTLVTPKGQLYFAKKFLMERDENE